MGRPPKSDLPPELRAALKLIAGNLRELRLERGLTQAQLAKASKVSLTTINEMEAGPARDVRLSTLVALAKVLSVQVVRLLDASDLNLGSRDHARLLKAGEDILKIARKLQSDD